MGHIIDTSRGYCTERSQKSFLWCGEMNHAFVTECIQLGHRNANADIKETHISAHYANARAQEELRVSVEISLRVAAPPTTAASSTERLG